MLHSLSFKKSVDASSAQLRLRLVSGAVSPRTTVTVATRHGNAFTTTSVLTLSAVSVSKIEVSVALGGVPIETVSLSFGALDETFFP